MRYNRFRYYNANHIEVKLAPVADNNMNKNTLDSLTIKFKSLEDAINTDVTSSLIGMIDLYEEVVRSYHHEIADSINIYVVTLGDSEVIKYLKMKDELILDTYCKKIFKEWINILLKK